MSKDDLIRIRSESDLKERLKAIAQRKRTDMSEFIRQRLWEIVEAEEKSFGITPDSAEAAKWMKHATEGDRQKSPTRVPGKVPRGK